MLGAALSLTATQAVTPFWLKAALKAEAITSLIVSGPAAMLDFKAKRYAQPPLTTAAIESATDSELQILTAMALADVMTFTRAGNATYVDPADGLIKTATADIPRFEADGLLLEGPSTNFATTSSHTAATPWNNLTSNGLTVAVVATGMLGDVPYADFSITGTMTAASAALFVQPTSTITAAATGQTWIASLYHQLISGTWPASSTGLTTEVYELDASSGYLVGSGTFQQPTTTLARRSSARTLSNVSTANVRTGIVISGTSGTTSFSGQVVRLFGLQLEQDSVPSSLIQTTGSAVTRTADNARLSDQIAAILRRNAVSLVLQGKDLRGSISRVIGGANSERLLGFGANDSVLGAGASNYQSFASGLVTPLPDFGIGLGFDASGRSASYNGAAVTTSATPIDTNCSEIYLGRSANGQFANGHMKCLTLWPFRMTDTSLQTKAVAYDA
ncbi:hypothetical protein FJU08_19080 [Martelella alba]|uniref:Uncharacterized protein n=1 Tax=Martelella alba TaxID=2590451 RepID=A0A506U0G8_9HYPH|nr:hypothetical protein [Martelella alba]TPW27833.1 hypothetical protein FJU08_19080 [Martelella alba]